MLKVRPFGASTLKLAGLAALALGMLSGCQTSPPDGPGYEQYIATWMQAPEDKVVSNWGIPDASHAMETGGRIIEYVRKDEGVVVCTTRFTIDSAGLVQKSWYKGTACLVPRSALRSS